MIDLIPTEYYQKRSVEVNKFGRMIVITIAVVVLAFGGLSYFRLVVKNNLLQRKIQITQTYLRKVQQRTTEVLRLKNRTESIQVKLEQKQAVMGQRVNWALPFYELKAILPSSSWLNRCQINQNQFKLSGYALQRKDLKLIIRRLKESQYFTNIYVELTRKTQFSQLGYPKRKVFQYQLSGQVTAKGG